VGTFEKSRREWLLAMTVLAAACRRREEGPPVGRRAGSTPALPPSEEVGITQASSGPPPPLPPPSDASPEAEVRVDDAPYPQTTPKETIANGALALHDWALPGDPKLSRRAVVLVPTHLAKGERVPLLLALHGLAETVDETLGAYAWVKKYGIGEGYAHARDPQSISVESLGKMVTAQRVSELQAELAARPFRGMVIACPYTPNIWKAGPTPDSVLDAYAPWLFDVLLPRLHAETPVFAGPERTGLDGVSLGGYASLGVGVRRLDGLGALGCVQAAISSADADRWSERIAKAFATHGARPLHLLTSTQDVFRAPVEALSAALKKRSIPHTLRVALGPHDQPFLRGPGSLEMLLWHDRALGGSTG